MLLDMVTGRWAGLATQARAFVGEMGETPQMASDAMLVLGLLAVAKGEWSQVDAEAAGRCALAGSPETTAGISELTAAAEELEALGVTWDVARVRAELRAHPGAERRAQGRPRYGDRLSPREQEVAELAGAGLSNREIAATLHLSPRTVEQHVARALKKLSVASRRDLALTDRGGKPTG
ncbi:helix-turn-helix transcriptional regulator [Streptomyces lunaelactis]|nr:helix-turn-helix transcriptional regulator [Streptomyces lunaelactis]